MKLTVDCRHSETSLGKHRGDTFLNLDHWTSQNFMMPFADILLHTGGKLGSLAGVKLQFSRTFS